MQVSRNIGAFIRTARVAHLATADKHGEPHVIPICFVFDGKCFYSPIDEKPKRVRPNQLKRMKNIRENPRVSLVIDRYDEDWARLGWVMLRGAAEILETGEEHDRAQALLRGKYAQYHAMSLAGLPVISLRIARVAAWGDLSAD